MLPQLFLSYIREKGKLRSFDALKYLFFPKQLNINEH